MKYWDNGFHDEQNENGTRVEITEERWFELLDGQAQGKEIYTRADGQPDVRDYVQTEADLARAELYELEKWFTDIYDNQIRQAERCERLGVAYDKKYGSVAELDMQAVMKAERITELRKLLG